MSCTSSEDLDRILRDSLSRRLRWRDRLVAWLLARVEKGLGPNGGYWGGVTMWDRLKAAAARATAFFRR